MMAPSGPCSQVPLRPTVRAIGRQRGYIGPPRSVRLTGQSCRQSGDREENSMVELGFWDERRGAPIARLPPRAPAAVPGSGDVVYIPDADQSGVYLHIRVSSRQFYY